MSKRKAVVNDIIYELDNEDVESSSDDEIKVVKKHCGGITKLSKNLVHDESCVEVVDMVVDSSEDEIIVHVEQNGKKIDNEKEIVQNSDGKNESCILIDENNSCIVIDNEESDEISKNVSIDDSTKPLATDNGSLNSPTSTSSSNALIGCVNRTPLLSVHFKNKEMANKYKKEIKKFMLNLIKLHDEEHFEGSENETDLELDIWPEDLLIDNEKAKVAEEDNIFFVDTAPTEDVSIDVPKYSKVDAVLSNVPKQEPPPPTTTRRPPMCFNCDGTHQLRECTMPRNNVRIAEKRKAMNLNRVGRYHVEDDQKYGHLVPGRISGKLRHALGLKRDELPMFIYRMRLLGYPHGWLEEARICHSGITMFDSTGKAVQDPDDEDGEICEPGSKDIFDIRKIHDFPGFNVPASSRYKEQAHLYNLPPLSEQDSKLNMLQALAPNAMKAYKRKKLTFFPSGSPINATLAGQAEMELDDGEETPEFPTVPPLPDDEPPAPPPPPPPLPDPPVDDIQAPDDIPPIPNVPPPHDYNSLPPGDVPLSPDNVPPPLDDVPLPPGEEPGNDSPICDTVSIPSKKLELKRNELVKENKQSSKNKGEDTNGGLSHDDSVDVICVEDEDEKSQNSGCDSPSLADLEEKKRLLLEALQSGNTTVNLPESPLSLNSTDKETQIREEQKFVGDLETPKALPQSPATGQVKSTCYGTPVLNTASSYTQLPSEDKFAKDICDVINFENLPDSTGKYEKISNLLKRVKSEVDRIQES